MSYFLFSQTIYSTTSPLIEGAGRGKGVTCGWSHPARYRYAAEEDGTRHVINDFIWEMSIRTISTKVEDVSHKNL